MTNFTTIVLAKIGAYHFLHFCSELSDNCLVAAARAHQVHRKDMREQMNALLCKPCEIQSRLQIVALL
jgi:hypothetical protein